MFTKVTVFLCIFSLILLHGSCTEFEVGATNDNLTRGWQVPPPNHPHVYNDWAQKNRFKVNDTLHFKYRKDSVMVVTDPEYDKCRSSQPLYFANNGDTTFVLDRPGLFYFISGVAGHCERGQKMVVKVLDLETPPDQSGNYTAQPDSNNKNNAAPQFNIMRPFTFPICLITFFLFLGFLHCPN